MNLMARIASAYGSMSKSQQNISCFFQQNPNALLFDPLAEFSRKADSSEATVVRFAQKLGYSGYTALQDALRSEAIETINRPGRTGSGSEMEDPFMAFADEASDRICEMYQNLDIRVFEKVCDLLMNAESVLVIAYMDAFGVGAQALHLLDGIRPNMRFSRLLFETNEVYRHIHKHTAILAISFSPHYKFTYELLQLADEKDCSIVLIADSLINPLTPFADFTLCAGIGRDEGSVLTDTCAPAHLIYMMSRRMAEKYPQQTADFQSTSLRRYEEFVT